MLKKKYLTVIGDYLECSKVKGCLPITCPPPDQLCLLEPLALKLCLLACWEDNTGMTKFGPASDYKRFYLHQLYWLLHWLLRLKKESNRFILTMQSWFFYSYFSMSHSSQGYLQNSFDEPVLSKQGTLMNYLSFRGIIFSQSEEQLVIRCPSLYLI